MGFSVGHVVDYNKSVSINKQQNINVGYGFRKNPYVSFTSTKDTFNKNSVERYMSEAAIKNAMVTNPKIKMILNENNMPVRLNMKELQELSQNHSLETQNTAMGIIEHLPKALRDNVNIQSIKDASYLHDIGKVLIPLNVLNKNGQLTAEEREIMKLHSDLGYELLKNTDIDTRTLYLVKYHHQNSSHTGYPKVNEDFMADINLQVLSAADKYSALTENRVYRNGLDKNKALWVLYKDVKKENLHPFVFKALCEYVNSCQNQEKNLQARQEICEKL